MVRPDLPPFTVLHFTSLHFTSLHFTFWIIFNTLTFPSVHHINHFPNPFSKSIWCTGESQNFCR